MDIDAYLNFDSVGLFEYKNSPLASLNANINYDDYFIDYFDQYNSESRYVNTNIKYEDFKNEMLKYFSESLFNANSIIINYFVNKDGMLYVGQVGASGYSYTVKNLEYKGIYDGKYEYEVNVLYEGINESFYQDYTFYLIEQNGNLVVDSYVRL